MIIIFGIYLVLLGIGVLMLVVKVVYGSGLYDLVIVNVWVIIELILNL